MFFLGWILSVVGVIFVGIDGGRIFGCFEIVNIVILL